MKKVVWKNGLLAGVVVSVFMAASMIYCKQNPDYMMGGGSMIVGYLSMIVAFSFVFVGIKSYRDQFAGGAIKFGKAFGIGLLIALIASTLYVVTWALVYHFVMPNFMEDYTQHILNQAKKVSSEAEFHAKAAEMQQYKEMYKSPLLFTLMTYAEILPVGILVALIAALILKRKKPEAISIAGEEV